MAVMIEDPVLIHSQLVAMGKNIKNSKIKVIITGGLIVAYAWQTAPAVHYANTTKYLLWSSHSTLH